jgi:hypothetical protein
MHWECGPTKLFGKTIKTYHALSVVAPAGDWIRSKKKKVEVRRWRPQELPLRDLLIIQNQERLSRYGRQEDLNGKAVALVDVVAVRDWKMDDLEASAASSWEPGWLVWELTNVRPFDYPDPLPARRRIYTIEVTR